jgi:hypothetical protein
LKNTAVRPDYRGSPDSFFKPLLIASRPLLIGINRCRARERRLVLPAYFLFQRGGSMMPLSEMPISKEYLCQLNIALQCRAFALAATFTAVD